MSTEDHQDPETSKAWQMLRAQAVTSGHGRIVSEFFVVGHSRVLPWARRPEAAALVAALADPDRDSRTSPPSSSGWPRPRTGDMNPSLDRRSRPQTLPRVHDIACADAAEPTTVTTFTIAGGLGNH